MVTNDKLLAERQRLLIESNIHFLCQGLSLLENLPEGSYSAIGGQVRHILEYYECFLNGVESNHLDYDARRRDESLERQRGAAIERFAATMTRLDANPLLRGDMVVWVRMEDAPPRQDYDAYMVSSIGRELQALNTHTIHHYAIIALILRSLGIETDRSFGMAPSTLRHMNAQRPLAMVAEAA